MPQTPTGRPCIRGAISLSISYVRAVISRLSRVASHRHRGRLKWERLLAHVNLTSGWHEDDLVCQSDDTQNTGAKCGKFLAEGHFTIWERSSGNRSSTIQAGMSHDRRRAYVVVTLATLDSNASYRASSSKRLRVHLLATRPCGHQLSAESASWTRRFEGSTCRPKSESVGSHLSVSRKQSW